MGRKAKKEEKPQVNPALEGFNIQINAFGEISSSFDVSKLNEFLDKTVDDKKFRGVDVVKRDEEEERAKTQVHKSMDADDELSLEAELDTDELAN